MEMFKINLLELLKDPKVQEELQKEIEKNKISINDLLRKYAW